MFGKSLHQKEYQIIKNGFSEGLSKSQISNLFVNQNILKQADIDPSAIDYAGSRTIKANFYEDCSSIGCFIFHFFFFTGSQFTRGL